MITFQLREYIILINRIIEKNKRFYVVNGNLIGDTVNNPLCII